MTKPSSPQLQGRKLPQESFLAERRRKISSNHSIPHPILPPNLRHGVTETSFEPFTGRAKPCWLFCRRCSKTRLRDAHHNWQNSDDHPQEWLDRKLHPSFYLLRPQLASTTTGTGLSDCIIATGRHRLLPLGTDFHRRCLDRCRFTSRDGRDKWHRPLPRASRLQGAIPSPSTLTGNCS